MSPFLAHPSRGNCREGRPVTARKRTLALSRSLSARARSRIAELDQEIERLVCDVLKGGQITGTNRLRSG